MSPIALPYFNLLDEPWIPVVMSNGERREMGLLELFREADSILVIEHASPLATAALYRLLLAILYRALNPESMDEDVAEWFKNGWPICGIVEYLEKWRTRFHLFDEKYPFWQSAEFDAREKKSWSVLAAEHNDYNAKVLFDHFDVRSGAGSRPADVACLLAAAQTFAVSAGKSEIAHTSTAPSAVALLSIPMGGNLRETLLLSLPPQNAAVAMNDLPVWERNPDPVSYLKTKPGRSPAGFSDLYTWRSRTVRLLLAEDGAVSGAGFASGMAFLGDNAGFFRDPMAAYVFREKSGFLPAKANERGLWRDFDSLLPYRNSGRDKGFAPLVIEHMAGLCRELENRPPTLSVMVCGQVNDNAKIEFWRRECFVLPETVLDSSRDIRLEVKELLETAQNWGDELHKACTRYAAELIRRNGERKPVQSDVAAVVAQMPCLAVYWNHLENAFKRGLESGFAAGYGRMRYNWLLAVRDAIRLAWAAQKDAAAGGDVWLIRAMTMAGGVVEATLRKLGETLEAAERDAAGKEEECLM